MKNILVPTNFSESCVKAEQLGIKMAKLYNAEIHFLHLMKTPVEWVKLSKLKEKRYPETVKQIGIARAALRELEKTAEHEGLKCRTFLEYDARQAGILEHSGHYNHDFIIIGGRRSKGARREITGSRVEEFVRKAKAPVIVLKDQDAIFPFKYILFVSDFKEDIKEAFKQVISIAQKCNAHIHLLRINTETDFNSIELGLNPIQELLNEFPEVKDYSMAIYNEPSVQTGIDTFVKQQSVDLIAMVTHGKTGFLNLFSKSIAEGVAVHASLPVMTIQI